MKGNTNDSFDRNRRLFSQARSVARSTHKKSIFADLQQRDVKKSLFVKSNVGKSLLNATFAHHDSQPLRLSQLNNHIIIGNTIKKNDTIKQDDSMKFKAIRDSIQDEIDKSKQQANILDITYPQILNQMLIALRDVEHKNQIVATVIKQVQIQSHSLLDQEQQSFIHNKINQLKAKEISWLNSIPKENKDFSYESLFNNKTNQFRKNRAKFEL